MVVRVAGRGFDVLVEAEEEKAQDGNGAKDDDEPHFRQHPCVQCVDGVGQVRGLRNRADGDGLIDARDAGTAEAKCVSHSGRRAGSEELLSHQATAHDEAQAELHLPFLLQGPDDVDRVEGQEQVGKRADASLKKAHLGANLDKIAGSGHGRVPQPLDGLALVQNQDDLDDIDNALKSAHEVE